MTWHWFGDWWPMGLSMLLGGLLWIAVVVAVVWLVVRLARGGQAGGGDSAEELLRKRYASGEIDAEEFQRRLEVLRHH